MKFELLDKKDRDKPIIPLTNQAETYHLEVTKMTYTRVDKDYPLGETWLKSLPTFQNARAEEYEEAREQGRFQGRMQGFKDGLKEGLKEGLKDGWREGRAEGREELLEEILLHMANKGMEFDEISRVTGQPRAIVDKAVLNGQG